MSAIPATVLPRNAAIDRLRGLSILLVVLHHIGLRIPLKDGFLADLLPRRFLNALIYNGYEAVFVFFVISGFLITGHALRRYGSLAGIDLRDFYVRRSARIVPLLALLLLVLSVLHLGGVADYVIQRDGQSLPRALLAVIGLHLNWYEGVTGYLPGNWDVLWSLSIEEVFYLGFPLLCLLLRRQAWLVLLLAGVALSLPLTRAALAGNDIWQEKAYLPGIAAIATGVLAAIAARHWQRPSLARVRGMAVIGAIGLAAVLLFGAVLWPLFGNGLMLLLTVSTALLLIAFDADARLASVVVRDSALARMGRLSYEIYLSHMFVVYSVVALYRHVGDIRHGWLWYPPIVLACAVLGAALARWISVPCEGAWRARLSRSPLPA